MDKTKLSQNIRDARERADMTQKQVAEACGMADSAIRKYESGRILPKLEMIERIARAIGITPFDLLKGVFDG